MLPALNDKRTSVASSVPDERIRILLVDDKPANLIALESFLSVEPYAIDTATSGAEALALMQSHDFAVVLTDVMMPEMDGFEFATRVKQIGALRDIPIIFMTAMTGDMADIFRGYAVGAVDYLLKPLEPAVVKAKVAVFVQLMRQRLLIERQAALLEVRVVHQLALSRLSRSALLLRKNDELLQEASCLVQETLNMDLGLFAGMQEPDGPWVVKVGQGKSLNAVPGLMSPADIESWVYMHHRTRESVAFHDMSSIDVKSLRDQLRLRGVVAGASVAIRGESNPFGAISVFSRTPHVFTPDETSFLLAVGNILGIAFERQRSESANRELTRSNNDLEQFSFAASHDLQEPLRKMTSFSQLLALNYRSKLEGDGLEYLDYIIDGATRMKTMIDDLLDLSRVGCGSIGRDSIPIQSTVDAALNNLAVTVAEQGAQVTVGPLPSLRVDPTNFIRLFQNLISNSIKYRSAAPPVVDISCERMENVWRFCVRDNGIGIDPAYLEKVFVIFKRLHSKTRYPGTGIGLALCKKIIDRHGGRIWAESTGNSGAAFYFTLPLES